MCNPNFTPISKGFRNWGLYDYKPQYHLYGYKPQFHSNLNETPA